MQLEKKNALLQDYVSHVEAVIYRAIADEKFDYICALASIYGKGRLVTKGMYLADK